MSSANGFFLLIYFVFLRQYCLTHPPSPPSRSFAVRNRHGPFYFFGIKRRCRNVTATTSAMSSCTRGVQALSISPPYVFAQLCNRFSSSHSISINNPDGVNCSYAHARTTDNFYPPVFLYRTGRREWPLYNNPSPTRRIVVRRSHRLKHKLSHFHKKLVDNMEQNKTFKNYTLIHRRFECTNMDGFRVLLVLLFFVTLEVLGLLNITVIFVSLNFRHTWLSARINNKVRNHKIHMYFAAKSFRFTSTCTVSRCDFHYEPYECPYEITK